MSRKIEASQEDRVTVGKIVGTHGVRGTMLLLPLTDFPERFLDMRELVLDKPGKPRISLDVIRLTPYEGKGTFFLNARDVNDKETAEEYKGSIVTISKEERTELSQDEYWIDDIVGLNVVENISGRGLGVLEEVMFTGSNDVYMVRTPEGALKPIPAIGEAINQVDIPGGVITVTIPEGLWD